MLTTIVSKSCKQVSCDIGITEKGASFMLLSEKVALHPEDGERMHSSQVRPVGEDEKQRLVLVLHMELEYAYIGADNIQ